jgi:AMME syndrome candidate gene 1 protein
LTGKDIPLYPATLADPKTPIFVTWKIKNDLRGCIGTFSPAQLSTILGKYALISAFEDDRFDPISLKELK